MSPDRSLSSLLKKKPPQDMLLTVSPALSDTGTSGTNLALIPACVILGSVCPKNAAPSELIKPSLSQLLTFWIQSTHVNTLIGCGFHILLSLLNALRE